MKRLPIALLFAALGLAAAHAQPAPPPAAGPAFACPAAGLTDDQRTAELGAFVDAAQKADPAEALPSILLRRRDLLEQNGCVGALENLHATETAMRIGNYDGTTWLTLGESTVVTLGVSPDFIRLVSDPRFPGDHAVEVYVRAAFAAPQRSGDNALAYDTVVSHAIYYCAASQRALVENDYFLGGKAVLREPHQPAPTAEGVEVYATEPIPAGSLNGVTLKWACGAPAGR